MDRRNVVAIGGSLGSIGVVKRLLATLPANFDAAILIVLHVGARGKNLLGEIFDSLSPLAVQTAREGDEPQIGHVYIAPANQHLMVIDNVIRLGRGPRENLSRPAIDPLLRSVGVCYGSRAIGVVLTGLLDDGASGLSDLKRCGGIAVVQNPRDAEAPDMPLEALGATDVDYRCSGAELPTLLLQLTRESPAPSISAPADISLEVQIALGREVGSKEIAELGNPAPFTCPGCGGVLSEMNSRPPLRYRCQVGHAYTAQTLLTDKEGSVDEAMRLALRVLEERAVLTQRMSDEARTDGRPAAARVLTDTMHRSRASADVLRTVLADSAMRSPLTA